MMDGGMMGGGMWAAMGIWALFVILTLLAVLVAAVLASVWLARNLRENGRGRAKAGPESPDEALRRRYAAGEIDDDEYERRLAALSRR